MVVGHISSFYISRHCTCVVIYLFSVYKLIGLQGVLLVFSLVGDNIIETYPSQTNPAATIQLCRFNYIIFYSLFGYKVLCWL